LFSLIELNIGQGIQQSLQSVIQWGVQGQRICTILKAFDFLQDVSFLAQAARFGSLLIAGEGLDALLKSTLGASGQVTLLRLQKNRGYIRTVEVRYTVRESFPKEEPILRIAFNFGPIAT